MKKLITLSLMALISQNISAQTLEECEVKITRMLSQVKTQKVRILALNEDGIDPLSARVDNYHMSENNLCGVELVKKTGLLTVTKFKSLKDDSEIPFRDVVKFESIMLNGSDPTRSNGRIKSKVSCSISENTVRYVTKVPVLTDGIRSPWAIEELTVSLKDKKVNFSLRASLLPINKVFRSITDCEMTLE